MSEVTATYTTTRTEYKVEVTHPTGFHSGTHTLTVTKRSKTIYQPEHRSVSGGAFGCGRDSYAKDDKTAITEFLREHACTVVKVKKVKAK